MYYCLTILNPVAYRFCDFYLFIFCPYLTMQCVSYLFVSVLTPSTEDRLTETWLNTIPSSLPKLRTQNPHPRPSQEVQAWTGRPVSLWRGRTALTSRRHCRRTQCCAGGSARLRRCGCKPWHRCYCLKTNP